MIFFGLVYFAQGIGQAGALISQPLMYYLKSLGMTTDHVPPPVLMIGELDGEPRFSSNDLRHRNLTSPATSPKNFTAR